MAGFAIPLATALIPTAIPLVVKLVERIFGGKTGDQKKQTVAQIITAIQDGLASAQKLSGQPLGLAQIESLIEQTVTALNAQGVLQGAATALDPGQGGNQVDGIAQILAGVSRILGGKPS